MSISLPLFDTRQDRDAAIRQAISRAISQCGKTREVIATQMSHLTGDEVTVPMINNYSAESKRSFRFPAAWVTAFCEVTGDETLARLLLPESLRLQLEFAEQMLARERADRQLEQLRARLTGGLR